MIEIKEIVPSEHINDVRHLMLDHWKETESKFTTYEPAPVIEMYRVMEKAGMILAFGAFKDGGMIGYAVAIIYQHLHYGFTYAHHDVLFVHRTYRGSIGLRLIRKIEQYAKERGAKMIMWHAKPDSEMEIIMEHKNYLIEDIVYRKEF